MPRDIDRDQRLNDIAEATIRVARSAGAHAVTIRAVAREMGGSTTLVTNYLPSRAALILNVLDRASEQWQRGYDELAVSLSPLKRLDALLLWVPDEADGPGDVFRTLLLEIVATAETEPDLRASLKRESEVYRRQIVEAATLAGFDDPVLAADTAYLLVRGAYFAAAEDPESWTPERVRLATRTLHALPRH